MAKRKGLGKGLGKGYRNIQGRDPKIHSDSAKGRKQPQKIPYIPKPNPPFPKKKEKKFDLVSAIIEYEGGNPTMKEMLELFSHLIKTGQAWSLQGHYGRTAMNLIENGIIDKKGEINWDNVENPDAKIYEDSDGDTIPDEIDCDPNDPTRQDKITLSEFKNLNEQERTDIFESELGRDRASRLQQLYQNSSSTGWGLYTKSPEETFREKAKFEGYTKRELNLFDNL